MPSLLQRIPSTWFESVGALVAGLAWIAIGAQILRESSRPGPSDLAILNVAGFLLTFIFWTLYGLRFARPAVWIGNLVAILLQLTLLIVILGKGIHP